LETLTGQKKFNRVYSYGKSYVSSRLVLYLLKNKHKKNFFGFSISKKIGNAVIRNKLRRRLKEIIRLMEKKDEIEEGFYFIFIARKPVNYLNFNQLQSEVVKLLKKAGVYQQ